MPENSSRSPTTDDPREAMAIVGGKPAPLDDVLGFTHLGRSRVGVPGR
jgi:hypothetical protein